ncbi:MAG: endolytic transglycosylase MltG [Firmicutes bacterium]|nr:endolytic transglycosylase MltG [Bacillota bacterium]
MENEKNNGLPDDWFEDLLTAPDTGEEIGTDEQAVSSHAMTGLSDLELEKIMQEAMSDDWDIPLTEAEPEPQPEPVQDREYADNLEEDPEDEPQALPEGGVPRKVRPRHKGGYGLFGLPHLLSTAIWAAIILVIGVSLGRLLWLCASDILAFGRPDVNVTITISETDTLDTITDKLYNAGLIRYPGLFKMYAKLAKVEEKDKISTGTFELNTMYDYHALVGGMSSTSSYRQSVKVMIPEGYTCAQIFALLEENGVCTVEKLESYAEQSEFASYEFLDGVERGSKYCLEGFLFPDTYEFYTNDSPQRIFHKFLSRFDDQFDDEMRAQIDTLNERLAAMYRRNGYSQEYADAHKLTLRDVVIVASMIEKETAHTGEIRNISSVIYNRLTNPGQYPKLNIDATIVYALGGKTDLTKEDLQVDSPYNTYLYEGLPPGAISNPGLFSLKAALDPADTDYYFYALDPTAEIREHRFFRTYEEHRKFLESLGGNR